MGNLQIAGPNEAIIISGGCSSRPKILIGTSSWSWACISRVQRISLEVYNVDLKCENALSRQGVSLTLNALAQVKIDSSPGQIEKALQQFLDTPPAEFLASVKHTLESHFRALIGTFTVEQVLRERARLFDEMLRFAQADLDAFGLTLDCFNVSSMNDHATYLDSIGKPPLKATVMQGETEKFAYELDTDRDIAMYTRDSELEVIQLDRKLLEEFTLTDLLKIESRHLVLERLAEADLEYRIRTAELQRELTQESLEVEVIERRMAVLIERLRVEQRDAELTAHVRAPADSRAYQAHVLADAQCHGHVLEAEGRAESLRLRSEAQAEAVRILAEADAYRMRKRAESFKSFGAAAILNQLIETLPEVAAAIMTPLSKLDRMVII